MRYNIIFIHIVVIIFFGNIHNLSSQEKIIKEGDSWLYFNDAIPEDNWVSNNLNDKNWKTGVSPLGYGDDHIKTEIGFGNDANKKHITKYFKKSFRVDNPFEYIIYKLNVQRDDGIVVYLNGYEILRDNMPKGKITHTTTASNLVFSNENEKLRITKILSSEDFLYGLNTISVSVHQARQSSSDCLFNLELEGSNNTDVLPLLLKNRNTKNIVLSSKIKELSYTLEIEKKELQLEFVEHAKRNILYILAIVSFLLIVAIVFIFILRKSSKTSIDNLFKVNDNLSQDLKRKDQEMLNHALNSLNNQQYLKELKKALEKSSSEDLKTLRKSISKICTQVEFNLVQEDDWDNLKKHFNAVHSGFLEKLTRKHDTLSETEIRHCVFMKLHMQTKEIARILHIDPRSVQVSRYRIKKKIKLGENDDLKDYLQNFIT